MDGSVESKCGGLCMTGTLNNHWLIGATCLFRYSKRRMNGPCSCWLAPPKDAREEAVSRLEARERGGVLSLQFDEVAMCFFVLGKDEVEKVCFCRGFWKIDLLWFLLRSSIRGNGVVLGFVGNVLSPSHVDHPPQSIITIITTTTTISTNKQQTTSNQQLTIFGWIHYCIHDQPLPGGSDQTGRQCRWEISVPPKKPTSSHQKKWSLTLLDNLIS